MERHAQVSGSTARASSRSPSPWVSQSPSPTRRSSCSRCRTSIASSTRRIVGVSWVISSYNLVVAVGALCLVPFARRLRPRPPESGVALFAAGSAGCAAAWTLDVLIGFRCLQALGGALLLAASLRGLAVFTGSRARGAVVWTTAGTIGAAAGPALGGVLTQLFDWRAIFAVQVPLAFVALAAMPDSASRASPPEPASAASGRMRWRQTPASASYSARSSARSSSRCCS